MRSSQAKVKTTHSRAGRITRPSPDRHDRPRARPAKHKPRPNARTEVAVEAKNSFIGPDLVRAAYVMRDAVGFLAFYRSQ
jgi:hypothetical protein